MLYLCERSPSQTNLSKKENLPAQAMEKCGDGSHSTRGRCSNVIGPLSLLPPLNSDGLHPPSSSAEGIAKLQQLQAYKLKALQAENTCVPIAPATENSISLNWIHMLLLQHVGLIPTGQPVSHDHPWELRICQVTS